MKNDGDLCMFQGRMAAVGEAGYFPQTSSKTRR